jgi:uncharacterized protein
MPLDAMQGFLAAVISAPDVILPSRWLPVVLGADREWQTMDSAQEALGLLMRFYNEIALDLLDGHGVDPLLYPVSDQSSEQDYAMWALGYLEGVELADPAWEAASDQDEVEDLLFPFLILAGGLEHDPVLRESLGLNAQEQVELLESCREELPVAVQDAYDYWLEKRSVRVRQRQEIQALLRRAAYGALSVAFCRHASDRRMLAYQLFRRSIAHANRANPIGDTRRIWGGHLPSPEQLDGVHPCPRSSSRNRCRARAAISSARPAGYCCPPPRSL